MRFHTNLFHGLQASYSFGCYTVCGDTVDSQYNIASSGLFAHRFLTKTSY